MISLNLVLIFIMLFIKIYLFLQNTNLNKLPYKINLSIKKQNLCNYEDFMFKQNNNDYSENIETEFIVLC